MDAKRREQLKSLPAVGELLARPELQPSSSCPRWALADAARAAVASARAAIIGGTVAPPVSEIISETLSRAHASIRPRLARAINATGVVIHTNLGRAPLSEAALARVLEVAGCYSNLEYNLVQGKRGSRHGIVDEALCRLTGAEAAMVVNNNAAAVLLALSVLATGREVIVSRGELVEIGGSFRIPDILKLSGCILREVGTTNRTRVSDYENAVGENTALLLKVHPSNFRVVGFTESVDSETLVGLGRRLSVPVMEDLGSGCLIDLGPMGLGGEHTAGQSVASGLDIVTMSGDKLLGGPQAGILLGRTDLINACRRHPLARAIRVDKMCLAALEGTLRSYLDNSALDEIPVLAALARGPDVLRTQAEDLCGRLKAVVSAFEVSIEEDSSNVGGGAFPEKDLPTSVVAVRGEGIGRLEASLRRGFPPIIARQRDGALVIDPRTLLAGDEDIIADAIAGYLEAVSREEGHGTGM